MNERIAAPMDEESFGSTEAALTSEILRMLGRRDAASSVCPSEIARSVADGNTWRPLMPRIRKILAVMIHNQIVIVTRGTRVLSADELERGTLRIRRGPKFN